MTQTDMPSAGAGDDLIGGAVQRSSVAMIVADARLEDMPITYANRAFETLTLYSREFAIGRNCRFLQGPGTDPADVDRIRENLRSGEEFQLTLVNHRADGAPFRNSLLISPVHDDDGTLAAYFGILRAVPEAETGPAPSGVGSDGLSLLLELQHRVKNHLAMIVSMIRIQASRDVTPESLKAISRRIEALGLLYEELLSRNGEGTDQIAAGAYLSRIATVVSGLEARGSIRTNVECDDIDLPVEQAARLGLLLSEFLTNAYEHAFEGRHSGYVEVRFHRTSGGIRLSVEDDGVGLPEGSTWPYGAASIEDQRDRARSETGELDTTGHGKSGVGGSIIVALTQSLGAELNVLRPKRGTIITLDIDPPE